MNSDLIGVIAAGTVIFANQTLNYIKMHFFDNPISRQIDSLKLDIQEIKKEVTVPK